MKVLAGIVLYNPEIGRLQENIDAMYQQVDTVLLRMVLPIAIIRSNSKDMITFSILTITPAKALPMH